MSITLYNDKTIFILIITRVESASYPRILRKGIHISEKEKTKFL